MHKASRLAVDHRSAWGWIELAELDVKIDRRSRVMFNNALGDRVPPCSIHQFAFRRQIWEHCAVAFDLKEIIAARLGENYELHERHLNRTLVAAQRVIGFDKVYARAEGAYLYDMDDIAYLDFLSGYSVFNIGRNHPVVKKAIRDVLDLDLPNMVQMDCSLLSGLLAEAITKRTPPHLDAVFFCNSGTEAMEGALKFARAATGKKRAVSLESAFHGLSIGALSLMGCESFTEGFGPLMDQWDTRIALDD